MSDEKPDIPKGMISPCKLSISNAADPDWVECTVVFLDPDGEERGGPDGEFKLANIHISMVPKRTDMDVFKQAMQELFSRLTDRAIGRRPHHMIEVNNSSKAD